MYGSAIFVEKCMSPTEMYGDFYRAMISEDVDRKSVQKCWEGSPREHHAGSC